MTSYFLKGGIYIMYIIIHVHLSMIRLTKVKIQVMFIIDTKFRPVYNTTLFMLYLLILILN